MNAVPSISVTMVDVSTVGIVLWKTSEDGGPSSDVVAMSVSNEVSG